MMGIGATPIAALAAAPVDAGSGASAAGGGAGFFPQDAPAFAGDRVQLELTAHDAGGGRFNAVHHTASGGVFTHIAGYIDCLAVIGNVAVATGVITQGFAGSGVDPVGTRVSLRITDAEPDVFAVDLAFFSGHAIAPCSSDPILTWTAEQGNFIVHE
jgi:hypothetical protein